MDYLKFTLWFCAIMVVFEWIWIIIALLIMGAFKAFKSEGAKKIGMYFERASYCFFLISSTILTINLFRIDNQSILFLVFMIFISLIYFIFFFADKRYNAYKSQQANFYIHTEEYERLAAILIVIETIFTILFVPLVFFPNLITNDFTIQLFTLLIKIVSINILGEILGIYGLFSLAKYIRLLAFSLFLIPFINRKETNH